MKDTIALMKESKRKVTRQRDNWKRKALACEADKQRLDGLQALLGRCSNKAVCRWSTSGRGWRLHESSRKDAFADVREAIDAFLEANQENP